MPKKHTIFNLYQLTKSKKAQLYYEDNLLDLTNPLLLNKKFSYNQSRQIKVIQGKESILDLKAKSYLQKTYQQYQYPIYMYDFETVKSAIPKYYSSKPYEQIPFQYSVHILLDNKFNEEKHNIKH